MNKEEFVTRLKEEGYNAEMTGNIPTIITESLDIKNSVHRLVKELGYSYSFRIKLKY